MIGITGYGAFVPRMRFDRRSAAQANAWFNPALNSLAKGFWSMCNWDEDSVTMAVAAARDCLHQGSGQGPRALYLASTTLPFLDRDCAGLAAAALGFPETTGTANFTTSQRAATSGLVTVLNNTELGTGNVLFLASEHRRTKAGSILEMLTGDGAAALMLGRDDVLCEYLGAHQLTIDFVDHFRGSSTAGEFDYSWEDRWLRDEGYLKFIPRVLAGLFKKAGITPESIDHFIMPTSMRGVAAKIAATVQVPETAVRDPLQKEMGEAGTAHALIMLADVLGEATPGQNIVVIGWGQGCDALLFRTTDAIARFRPRLGVRGHLALGREETLYTKFLAFNGLIKIERGLRSEVDKQTALSAFYRNRHTLTSFVGGKCRNCGAVQFPKSRICVGPNCGDTGQQDDHPMADAPARLKSWTADRLTYTPDPPQHFGMVEFEEGGRLMADITDVVPGEVSVGMPIRMEFRIKDFDDQRGFTRYFWKATLDRTIGADVAAG
ncbi:MAG: OB-fold domain-containing protein [Alphaproteobacteria bacterium]